MSDFKNTTIRLILQAGKPYELALGGGNALEAHQIINRETKDIDGFINSLEPEAYDAIEAAKGKWSATRKSTEAQGQSVKTQITEGRQQIYKSRAVVT
jgi:hypothetical protein